MSEHQVRPIEDGDIDAVVALWQACDLLRPWNEPERDIERARAAPQAEIFVVAGDDGVIASVMAGHDGHRGWIYYLASAPERRGEGLGRLVMEHAEQWLRARRVPKIDLMIRAGNRAAGFYAALGYETEARSVMAKWLEEPPEQDHADTIEVTITYLQMLARPTRPQAPLPGGKRRLSLIRAERPPVEFYRYLYYAVGGPWSWYERNQLSDEKLVEIIHDEGVEIYVLYVEGAPAGYAELDFRNSPDVELAYFGLTPDFIGQGYGGYLLDWTIDTAWTRQPGRLWVHTCTLDHPAALPFYQKAGFTPYDQKTETIPAYIRDTGI
jgi:GNAT superfamily N-acetyltransferase